LLPCDRTSARSVAIHGARLGSVQTAEVKVNPSAPVAPCVHCWPSQCAACGPLVTHTSSNDRAVTLVHVVVVGVDRDVHPFPSKNQATPSFAANTSCVGVLFVAAFPLCLSS